MVQYFLKSVCLCLLTLGCLSCDNSVIEMPVPNRVPGYCLTFDDHYITQWGSIKSLLDSNNVHATFFITNPSELSIEEIKILDELQKSGNEIGCHSLRHLNAIEYLKNHSVQEYIDAEIMPALKIFSNYGIYPTSFAFPQGLTADSLNAVMLTHFKILRTVAEQQRYGFVDKVDTIESIFYKFAGERVIAGLGIDKNFNISIEQIRGAFNRTMNKNEIVIFYAHCPVEKVTAAYQTEKNYLRELIKAAKSLGLKSYKLSDLAN